MAELHESSHQMNRNPVESLVADLESDNIGTRESARRALVTAGEDAVPVLREALRSPRAQARWEAAKALGQIGGTKACETLVDALGDEGRDVRWMAAEGLIENGDRALEPLLHELISHSGSIWIRQGATVVLDRLLSEGGREFLRPVMRALTDGAPIFEVPIAAYEALQKMQRPHSTT